MKNELQTLRLYSPLFPHIYRDNEWGDYENEPEDLEVLDILEYEDAILDRIEKEKLPDEGERGLAVYLDDNLSRKIYCINPTVEEWSGELWGVTEVQTHGELYVSFWDSSDRFFIKLEDELKGNQTLSFCMSILKSSGFAAKEVMEYQ